MKKNLIIAVAAAIAMGGMASIASAAISTNGANNIVANEAVATKKAAVVVTPVAFTVVTADFFAAGAPTTMTLTTSAGVFATGTTAKDSSGTTLLAGAANLVTVPAAGIATNLVSWTIAAAGAAADVITFTPTIDLSGVAAGTAVTLTIATKSAGGVVLGSATTTAVATVKSIFSHTETNISDTATVASGFKTFLASGTAVMAASDLAVKSLASSVPAAAGNTLVTLSGNFASIKSISIVGGTGSTAAGVTTAVAGTTKGVATQMWIDTVNGKAYAVVPVANGLTTVNAIPTITADGTPIAAKAFTVDVALLADANYVAGPIGAAAATVLTIKRNGASAVSGNIGAASRVRLTNNSGVASAYTVTATDAAGVAVPLVGAAISGSVPANGTVDILPGVMTTAYPTGTRFSFNVESSDLVITHIKKNASGLNTNVYRSNAANGGAL
ncbi:hypothetical protein JYT48_02970 [Mariprofundus ferrooxydans]|nr:hypothetical protein [Mariprofundus ferrooxydans]